MAYRSKLLWIIVAMGALLRAWGLPSQSLTMDEIVELKLASLPLRDIVRAADGFPPFYHLLLHFWPGAVPGADGRWFSLACGVLALPVMWWLGREVNGNRTAWWSVLLLTVSPFHVWLSQELRAYSLYFLLALTTLWLFLRAMRSDRPRDWAFYTVAVLCGLYTHYYFGFLILTLILTAPLYLSWRPRWRRLLQVHIPIILLALPLLLLLEGDLQLQQSYLIRARPLELVALGYTFFTFLTGFSLGLSLRELHTASAAESILAILPWALILGPAAGYLLYVGWARSDQRSTWWRVATVTVLPIAGAGILAAVLGVGYRIRYVSWCAGPFLILLAMGLSAIQSRRRALSLFAVLASVAAMALLNRQTNSRYANEDVRSAAREIEARVDRSTPIFVIAGYMSEPLRAYLQGRWDLRPLTLTGSPTWPEEALRQVRTAGPPGSRFLLLYSRPFDGDPSGRVRSQLSTRAGLRLAASVAGVELYEGSVW